MRKIKSVRFLSAVATLGVCLSLTACNGSGFKSVYKNLFWGCKSKCEPQCNQEKKWGHDWDKKDHDKEWKKDWNGDWKGDDYGNGGVADSGDETRGNDLIAEVVEHSEAEIRTVGHRMAAQYSLSEDTGMHIARTMNSWATIASKRNLTDADISDFSKRLYGLDANQAKDALAKMKAGDASGIERASSEVGRYWGTTPETVKTIFKDWYREELKEMAIR